MNKRKEGWVLWLTSERPENESRNAYGYWMGKDYKYCGELFPVTDSSVTERTKVYTSKKRAENALTAALERPYAYVLDGRIEPYPVPEEKQEEIKEAAAAENIIKYAIYRGNVGLYAKEYVDSMQALQRYFMLSHYVKEDELPIVVNRAGGRTSFYPTPDNFIKIIEVLEEEEPLTREQRYPKNSLTFEYGWIDTDGNTYSTPREGHCEAAEAICKELGYDQFRCERALEQMGWAKVTKSWERGVLSTRVYVEDHYITKAQADKLIDLGLGGLWQVESMIRHSADLW